MTRRLSNMTRAAPRIEPHHRVSDTVVRRSVLGVAGIILAIPSLVALEVAAEHREGGKELAEFLSPNSAKRFKSRRAGAAQKQIRS
jgi:hypothetical protein